MKIENYEKATDLLESKEKLCFLDRIFGYPYPHIRLKKLSFFYDSVGEISFISFDKKTREELKSAIQQVIAKRIKEIDEEIKDL